MGLKIRKIEAGDNLALANMIKSVFEEHDAPRQGTVYSDPTTNNLFELFQKPKSIHWVADLDGEILGCCGIYPTEGLPNGCAELVKFYLPKKARGKGIGKELMEMSIKSAKEFGYKQLYIESLPQFAKAVGIYEKLGFAKLNNPLGNSGHGSCNIWMLKDLN
ncbi:MAG: GNAT family N-acetyltransferase [Cyclobacteriaceae bacterium]